MSAYKAIALDMDGTLLTRDHRISPATRQALERARAQGIKVLLVTGRHFMTARPFHADLALDTPMICSNGAYLFDRPAGRIVEGDPLSREVSDRLLSLIHDKSLGALIHLEEGIAYLGCEDHVARMRQWSSVQPDHLKIRLLPVAEQTGLALQTFWKVELFHRDHDYLQQVVEQEVAALPVTADWAAPYAIELVDPRCSKGNRLARWAAQNGISMEEVVAFGDNHNDVSMFEQAGLAVAMGNAKPEIQARADKVTADHNEDGIAVALERWVF